MTIYRRRAEYEMLSEPSQPVSHDRLTQIIQDLRRELPDIGQSMVAGRLQAMGIQVSRERIRETIRRTDPLNSSAVAWCNKSTSIFSTWAQLFMAYWYVHVCVCMDSQNNMV